MKEQGRIKCIENYCYFQDRLLGDGICGKVYEGFHINNKEQPLAIKRIDKEECFEDKFLTRSILNEINILKHLRNSAYIVNFKACFETNKSYYIIQEFCNSDLRKELFKNKRFQENKAVFILKHLVIGFSLLVKNGIIHRDLKPQNILFHNKKFKIADFGFSRYTDAYQRNLLFTRVGTPNYMSPQILQGSWYSDKSDIWSLGVVFYQILQGRVPWRSECQIDLQKEQKNFKLTFNSQVSDVSKQFILKCLVYEEKDRMDWRQLLEHPIFKGEFDNYLHQIRKFGDSIKYSIWILKQEMTRKNFSMELNLKRLSWSDNLDTTQKKNLFLSLMRQVSPQISKQQVNKLINCINSGHLFYENIVKWFKQNIGQTHSKQPSKSRVAQWVNNFENKLAQIIDILPQSLEQLSKTYPLIDFDIFKKIVQGWKIQIKDPQLKTLFQYRFDLEKKGQISFQLFSHGLDLIAGVKLNKVESHSHTIISLE